jgi:hypothetical protein
MTKKMKNIVSKTFVRPFGSVLDSRSIKSNEEQYAEYLDIDNKKFVQYDYRNSDGEFFSCVKKSVEECRIARDRWIEKKLS